MRTAIFPALIIGVIQLYDVTGSAIRQNFNEESEADLNLLINMELYVSYVYTSMSFHFDRDDVALPAFTRYFKKASDKKRELAEKLMAYQNKRGGAHSVEGH